MSGSHGPLCLPCVLDLTGLAGYHINYPRGLAVVVPADHILPSSPSTLHHGCHILHPVTADTLSLGMQAIIACLGLKSREENQENAGMIAIQNMKKQFVTNIQIYSNI